jgi:outer membrane protein TolC
MKKRNRALRGVRRGVRRGVGFRLPCVGLRLPCVAFAAVVLLSGCRSGPVQPPAAATTAVQPPAATAVQPQAIVLPPPDGWGWDTLARMAAANSGEARALLLDAQAERHQTAVDTGWRNPQFRAGRHWGDQDASTPGRTGLRTYPDEVNMPRRPFTRYREWEDRTFDGDTFGLRVYTANPFVNRWLRKRGEASARALEKASDEEAYAVYCEVRTLCLEAELLREETDLLEQMAKLREALRDVRREQSEAGVTRPLDLIRAETQLAALRTELSGKRMARQQLVRSIAVLAGVPAQGFKLCPRTALRPPAPAGLDPAALTDLAFARRPDLARLQHEKTAAEYAVKAARAGQLPWFEYVESTYENEKAETDAYEAYSTGHDRTTRNETEWQVRIAMTVPVFNWLGDELKLTRAQLAAAEARAQGQYEKVRAEVGGVLEDYLAASAEWARLSGEGDSLRAALRARLDILAQEPAVQRGDVLEMREELLAYRRVCLKAERECLFIEQCLETVSGGPLTGTPEPGAAPPDKKETSHE